MADVEILQGEIEALQEAVLETDQRVDAIEESEPAEAGEGDATQQCLGRIEALAQQTLACLERMEQRTEQQIEEVVEQVEEATAAAEVAAVSALVAAESQAQADVISEDTSQAPEEAVEEVEAPPEETAPRQSMSWWERTLLLK